MTFREQTKIDVLRWVNGHRTLRGKPTLAELPEGLCSNGHQCVLARALDAEVSRTVATYEDECGTEVEVILPPEVARFVWEFDQGDYPELVQA